MKPPRKSQLNVRVTDETQKNILFDLAQFPEKSKDVIVEAALMNMFLLRQEERKKLYDRFPDKIFGRPTKQKYEAHQKQIKKAKGSGH